MRVPRLPWCAISISDFTKRLIAQQGKPNRRGYGGCPQRANEWVSSKHGEEKPTPK